jgi:hypothetical protein
VSDSDLAEISVPNGANGNINTNTYNMVDVRLMLSVMLNADSENLT